MICNLIYDCLFTLKFSIVFKARNNQSLNRDDVISSLAEVVGKCNKAHSVDLSHPDLTIVVEVIKVCSSSDDGRYCFKIISRMFQQELNQPNRMQHSESQHLQQMCIADFLAFS